MVLHFVFICCIVIQDISILIYISNSGITVFDLLQILLPLLLYSVSQISGFLFQLTVQLLSEILIKNSHNKGNPQYQNCC